MPNHFLPGHRGTHPLTGHEVIVLNREHAAELARFRRLMDHPDSAGAVERLARELKSGDDYTVQAACVNLGDFATPREVTAVKRALKGGGDDD